MDQREVPEAAGLTMRMLVVAIALASAACASAPRNPVLDKYPAGVVGQTTVVYYDVHGRTFAELRADMRRLGPSADGRSYVGETRSPMQWRWQVEPTGTSYCTVRDVIVSVNAQITLPRWTPPPDAEAGLVTEWNRFITALEVHEAGHKDISAKAGREIRRQLMGMTAMCSTISNRATEIGRTITDRATVEQKLYDASTQHGLTQGTGFRMARAASSVDSIR